MTLHTKRWMKRELDQLLAQRACYLKAETASSELHHKVRHTTQRLRLDQEILGRKEALDALGTWDDDDLPPNPRLPAVSMPIRRLHPAVPAPSVVPRAIIVCAATFVLGFAGVGVTMSMAGQSQPTMARQQPTPRPVEPQPTQAAPRVDDEPILAAGARASWGRSSRH